MKTMLEDVQCAENFSLTENLLQKILVDAKPLGHNQKANNLNLGFGFVYYALVRAIRPKHILVIGSGYGFSVVCLALGLKDNGTGRLTFVDPSYSLLKDGPLKTVGGIGQWNDEAEVNNHFKQFGVDNIVKHYKLRNNQFFSSYKAYKLPKIDIAFIDGEHTYEGIKYDFVNTLRFSHKNTYIFLHDTNLYIREIVRHCGVKQWLELLKMQQGLFETVDFPFDSGVAVVRVLKDKNDDIFDSL